MHWLLVSKPRFICAKVTVQPVPLMRSADGEEDSRASKRAC